MSLILPVFPSLILPLLPGISTESTSWSYRKTKRRSWTINSTARPDQHGRLTADPLTMGPSSLVGEAHRMCTLPVLEDLSRKQEQAKSKVEKTKSWLAECPKNARKATPLHSAQLNFWRPNCSRKLWRRQLESMIPTTVTIFEKNGAHDAFEESPWFNLVPRF